MIWTEIASEFAPDGSLRDVYVFETTIDDWQKVLDALKVSASAPSFTINGETALWPESVAELFQNRAAASPLLTLRICSIQLNCHFFDEAEIEFDLDPREMTGQRELDALRGFLNLLSAHTGKTAFFDA